MSIFFFYSMDIHYRRVLLKLSGEALGGANGIGLDPKMLAFISREVKKIRDIGVEVGLVVGAGNIFRGMESTEFAIDPIQGDFIGMEATTINALVVKEALSFIGIKAMVLSLLGENKIVDNYHRDKALKYIAQGYTIIFAGGTGNPFFTTDTAAVLRGLELDADVVLKATKVDGVYSADPKKDPHAQRYETISYQDALAQNLQVMDQTALVLAKENRMPMVVFELFRPDALLDLVRGKSVGTLITE